MNHGDGYYLENKLQSSQWKITGSPLPKKAYLVKSIMKTMLIYFFNCRSIVHSSSFHRVKISTRNSTWRFWRDWGWASWKKWQIFGAQTTGSSITTTHMTFIVHPLYSPDLALCDFFLFPGLKGTWKGMCFTTREEVKQKILESLKNIPMIEFMKCFEQCKYHLDKCIVVNTLKLVKIVR